MEFYPKINTLFKRDKKFKVTSTLRMPVIDTIKEFQVSEKINGTNIRIILNEKGEVTFGGRTKNAQIQADLVTYLYKTFTPEKMKALWQPNKDGKIESYSIVIFGEGYGAGIQKGGGDYRPDKAVRIFDVLIAGRWWLDWEATEKIAKKLGVKTAPYIGDYSLKEIIKKVKKGLVSRVALEDSKKIDVQAEGIVGRTKEPLFDKRGERLIIKLKTSDFN